MLSAALSPRGKIESDSMLPRPAVRLRLRTTARPKCSLGVPDIYRILVHPVVEEVARHECGDAPGTGAKSPRHEY